MEPIKTASADNLDFRTLVQYRDEIFPEVKE
jgi:hypothetical protein